MTLLINPFLVTNRGRVGNMRTKVKKSFYWPYFYIYIIDYLFWELNVKN